MTCAPALWDGESAAKSIYLHPGQIFASAEHALITTVLGSCVSVCLFDPKSHAAGINHFLLPKNPVRGSIDVRYGNTAMDRLLIEMWKRGASMDSMVAKIFGGACVLQGLGSARNQIGAQNAETAREFLSRNRITVAADETGGTRGRKLLFDTATGSAWLKEI